MISQIPAVVWAGLQPSPLQHARLGCDLNLHLRGRDRESPPPSGPLPQGGGPKTATAGWAITGARSPESGLPCGPHVSSPPLSSPSLLLWGMTPCLQVVGRQAPDPTPGQCDRSRDRHVRKLRGVPWDCYMWTWRKRDSSLGTSLQSHVEPCGDICPKVIKQTPEAEMKKRQSPWGAGISSSGCL